MNKKKQMIVAGLILVAGLSASVYLWVTVGFGEDKGDATVAGQMLTFTCKQCKKTFNMTVADAGAMRRTHEGQIICPECHAAGAQKHDVRIVVSGDGGFKPDDEGKAPEETQEAAVPKKPKVGGGGARKKQP